MSNKVPLPKLVESLDITHDELRFQAHRLETMVSPRTESEQEFHENLKKGYTDAAYWLGILTKYHKGRLDREMSPVPNDSGETGQPYYDEETI